MAAKMEKTRHPGIYKRGSKYAVRYRVNGRQKFETAPTLKDALQIKRRREADRDSGEFFEASREKFEDYAAEWIDRYQGNGRRGFTETTRDDYRRDLRRYAFPHLGSRPLATITPRHISTWIGWLCDPEAQGKRVAEEKRQRLADRDGVDLRTVKVEVKPERLSDATVRRIVAPVRSCLSTARREGLIRHNPVDGAVLPRREEIEEEPKSKALTRGELATFLAIVNPEWRLMFEFLAATGLRWSEVIALKWSDLKLDGSNPHVKVRRAIVRGIEKAPKSKYGRRDVPLDFNLADRLRACRGDADALVFPASNGAPLRQENVRRRILAPAAEEADVSWIGFHTFRHTCASLLFSAGKNPKQAQRWLGHHSAAFTLDTYAHLLDEGVGEAINLGTELESGSAQSVHMPVQTQPNPSGLDSENSATYAAIPDRTELDLTPALRS